MEELILHGDSELLRGDDLESKYLVLLMYFFLRLERKLLCP